MVRKSKKTELLRKELINSVPDEQRNMITQPITFTYLKGEMTMMQTRIQTKIMKRLQGRISKALRNNSENGYIGDLFTDEDFSSIPGGKTKYLTFEIKYSELGVEPTHYDDVDKAAIAMLGLVYEKEVVDENGKRATEYTVLFDKVSIPNKDASNGVIERRDSIKLRMLPEAARDMFQLIPYHRYLEDAISLFKSNYAGRIYLLINANKQRGTWKVEYSWLRKILLTTYDKESKKVTVDKYKAINDFKKRVLEPARKEIYEVADRVDCTFDYEFIYPEGKKRGTPEFIVFHIHTTAFWHRICEKKYDTKYYHEMINTAEDVSYKEVKNEDGNKDTDYSGTMEEW